MAEIAESDSSENRIGSSFQRFTVKLDKDGTGVGPPNSIEVMYSDYLNWPAKTGQGNIEKIDESTTSPPLPILLHLKQWGPTFVFNGASNTGIPIGHYTVDVCDAWLIIEDNKRAAYIRADKEGKLIYKTKNWGKKEQDIIERINK